MYNIFFSMYTINFFFFHWLFLRGIAQAQGLVGLTLQPAWPHGIVGWCPALNHHIIDSLTETHFINKKKK
jgi:hypothetical protein